MYCRRCGAPSEKGAKFCAVCGAALREDVQPDRANRSIRKRAGELIGSTRKARIITATTFAAILVAIVAFIFIAPAKEARIPRDAYTIAADRICVQAKRQIVASERASLRNRGPQPGSFAQALVPIVAKWRTEFAGLVYPPDRVELVQGLSTALREVEVEIAALARIADEGVRDATVKKAKQVDEVTSRVEAAVSALGLSHCSRLTIGLSTPSVE